MRIKYLIPFLVLVLVFGLIGCGNGKRNEEIKNYLDEFVKIENRFIDKYDLAGTTSRIALSPVISDMQDIRRELENLNPPEDVDRLVEVKELCLHGMNKTIRGFQEFQMENEDKSLELLNEADKIFISVAITINEIKEELIK